MKLYLKVKNMKDLREYIYHSKYYDKGNSWVKILIISLHFNTIYSREVFDYTKTPKINNPLII